MPLSVRICLKHTSERLDGKPPGPFSLRWHPEEEVCMPTAVALPVQYVAPAGNPGAHAYLITSLDGVLH